MTDVRLVVTDLDGTLWHSGEVHPATRSTLARLTELGLSVVGATARRRRSASQALLARRVSLDGVVVNDGALGYHGLGDEPWRRCGFEDRTTRALVEVLAGFGHEPMFETEHLGEGTDVITGECPSVPTEYFASNPPLRVDLGQPLPHPAYAAVAFVERAIIPGLADAVVREGLGTTWAEYWPQYPETGIVRFRPPRCSKWAAVEAYCALVGLETEAVLAVGDNDNDVEMISNAGVGVAVASGSEAAREAAGSVIAAPHSGGWEELLDLVA